MRISHRQHFGVTPQMIGRFARLRCPRGGGAATLRRRKVRQDGFGRPRLLPWMLVSLHTFTPTLRVICSIHCWWHADVLKCCSLR